jgi:YVTN family beta-propeller protein
MRHPAVKLLLYAALLGATLAFQSTQARFPGPTSSGPIAVTSDDSYVWVANPETNSVTLIDVRNDANKKLAEVQVGKEPQNLAITPNNAFVYVSNTVTGTISVVRARPDDPQVVQTIEVGTEPYGLAFTPNGRKLYVANARSNTLSVIDVSGRRVDATIDLKGGLEPRGIAVTNDGDGDDTDEKVYVTQFLGVDRPGVLIGADDYKEGRVSVISTATDTVLREVVLKPLADTGFLSNGSALKRIPATNPATFFQVTGAFPNQLNSVAIKDGFAYVPNTGASPDGPTRFNVNLQGLLSTFDTLTDSEAEVGGQPQTLNMNRGINFEPTGPNKIFVTSPWAIAFKRNAPVGYVVAASSNIVVKVDLDRNGTPSINAPKSAGDPGNVIRVLVGQNPRGIALNSSDTRAYVMNEVSRNVSVIDLTTHKVTATVASADLPKAGTLEATVLLGKALFNSSTGVNLPELGSIGVVPTRLSSEGWGSCFAWHPSGLTDGVVWIFGAGPRRTIPMHATYNPRDPTDIKLLNHSAIFDEVQDFELNIRNVSGGLGLITEADGVTPAAPVAAFTPANAGRSKHWDAVAEYVARGIRSPISPFAPKPGDSDARAKLSRGRLLFQSANCASCHGGGGWASSRRTHTPPPDPVLISNTQLAGFLRKVGTFDATKVNEVRASGVPSLGADGYNPPSLLGAVALGPYLHNGSALTLEEVMDNVIHRSAGTSGVDTLATAADRKQLLDFLNSIDASTTPFVIP